MSFVRIGGTEGSYVPTCYGQKSCVVAQAQDEGDHPCATGGIRKP